METSSSSFLIIITFLLLQTFGASSNNVTINVMTTFPNPVTCIATERESMLIFKQSLTGNLSRLSTWRGVECCEWLGIECDKRNNGHVVTLDLRNPVSYDDYWYFSVLGGETSPSLLNLKHLRYLDLSSNNFTGQKIPDFLGSFKYLKYLNLSYSQFQGVVPPHLGNLSTLQYLDLTSVYIPFTYNMLIMYDLQWVSSLSSLKHLILSGVSVSILFDVDWVHPVNMLPSLLTLNLRNCDITGTPSVRVVNLTSLNSLDLSGNRLDSTIPLWLSNLTALMHLDLSCNNFHGQIPDFLGSFKRLKYLDLSYTLTVGEVPPHLGNLSSLQHLDLNSMYPSGLLVVDDLQWVSSLSSLKHLDLSGVSIPHDVDWFHSVNMLPSLLTLNLAACDITSAIPWVSFANFTSLSSLDLSQNQINSTIPLWLSNLTDLMHLDLHENHFHGQIPDFLGTLSNLVHLDVSYNLLVGVLSELHFTKLNNLTILWLYSNPSLALNVSSQWIPPFQLQQFVASDCNVGPRFPNWLQTQTNLQTLALSNSSIRDTIPEWFENISFNVSYLDLSHNQISGKLPPLQGATLKMYLLMNSNKFEGSLTSFPKNVDVLDLSDNLLSGHVPQTDGKLNPILESINLSKNRFTGRVPEHFCKVLSINILDLSQNKFSGRLPQCLGNLNKLRVMDLSNNTITDDVPSSLGSLDYLVSLHLGNNRLHGDLPVSLQHLISLETMDLGNNLLRGNIPFWIGEKLSELRYLNLQSNEFTGKIPLQLCHLKTLQVLNLAHYNITGTIPRCFGNLTAMIMNDITGTDLTGMITDHILHPFFDDNTYEENTMAYMKGRLLLYTHTIGFLISLDLSSNNITGEIPDVLMNLAALKNLNLSRNLLKGQISMTIGNLKEIESLDLSMNKLSGQIPQSLATLQHISYLNLSFNNLSGVIPVGNQIQTLDDPSIYEGNKGLCALPLRSCTRNNLSFKHVDEDEGQDDTKDVWFCGGMGFVVGFVGLIGSLYFNKTWRFAYYGILENAYDWLAVSLLLTLARVKRKFV